jgi:uncharacterized protein YdeI (YjbR/CyaY-like superfamily)
MRTLHVTTRAQWRRWLERNHASHDEIWLVSYRKHTGRKGIDYNAAVEEALCFGWIDSIRRSIDADRLAQRFTPRRNARNLSEMNRQRVMRLIEEGRMTPAGLAAIGGVPKQDPLLVPPDIRKALRAAGAWGHFQNFPEGYRRLRIAWIDGAHKRPDEFAKRLGYFVEMTAKNKRYGYVKEFR